LKADDSDGAKATFNIPDAEKAKFPVSGAWVFRLEKPGS
jgi:hypothetical protein